MTGNQAGYFLFVYFRVVTGNPVRSYAENCIVPRGLATGDHILDLNARGGRLKITATVGINSVAITRLRSKKGPQNGPLNIIF